MQRWWDACGLAPRENSAGDLEIQNGMVAVVAWRKLVDPATPAAERPRLRGWLMDYCGRDAVLMHDVLEALRRLVGVHELP